MDIQALAHSRATYKPLTGFVNPEHKEVILREASGVTPALCNEYNYCVDVTPDSVKEDICMSLAQESSVGKEYDETCVVDVNTQLMAPLVLLYSLRYNPNNTNIEQFSGPLTMRDQNIIAMGMCLWHTTMIAEGLGYKTSYVNLSGHKQKFVKNKLGLNHPDQDNRAVARDGNYEYMPLIFLCIGTEGTINTKHRTEKYAPILNRLNINE